jgi:hypothetical protein
MHEAFQSNIANASDRGCCILDSKENETQKRKQIKKRRRKEGREGGRREDLGKCGNGMFTHIPLCLGSLSNHWKETVGFLSQPLLSECCWPPQAAGESLPSLPLHSHCTFLLFQGLGLFLEGVVVSRAGEGTGEARTRVQAGLSGSFHADLSTRRMHRDLSS